MFRYVYDFPHHPQALNRLYSIYAPADSTECIDGLIREDNTLSNTSWLGFRKYDNSYIVTISLSAKLCEIIEAPFFGEIDCDGYIVDRICRFTCHEGYHLDMDSPRRCLPSGKWSNRQPSCIRKYTQCCLFLSWSLMAFLSCWIKSEGLEFLLSNIKW